MLEVFVACVVSSIKGHCHSKDPSAISENWTFSETSRWIDYSTLQTFFTNICNLEMLWSLRHAQNLSKLAIRIHCAAHYTPEDCLPILEYCPHGRQICGQTSMLEPLCSSTLARLDVSDLVFRDEAAYKSF